MDKVTNMLLIRKVKSAIKIYKRNGATEFYYQMLEKIINLRSSWFIRDYQQWLKKKTPDGNELEQQKVLAQSFIYQPKFSFITPVYNPPAEVFEKMIASVISQTYQNWELLLVNGSTSNEPQMIIDQYSIQDTRVKTFSIENKGISGNSNIALSQASGEYVVLLDHDDVVESALLFEITKELNKNSDIDILYYDEDNITEDDIRIQPRFKPKRFRRKMFNYINYLTHCVIRKKLIDELGHFNPDFDGAQDWELLFRCTENTGKIKHIAKVLYSWRLIQGSTAMGISEKPYAREKQEAARKEHFKRIR